MSCLSAADWLSMFAFSNHIALAQLSLSLSNQDGIMAEEPQTLTHISAPSMKLPPSNCALPNQALGSVGLGMQNLNSVRQVSQFKSFRVLEVNSTVCFNEIFKGTFELLNYFIVFLVPSYRVSVIFLTQNKIVRLSLVMLL